jgi:hypothetical protein
MCFQVRPFHVTGFGSIEEGLSVYLHLQMRHFKAETFVFEVILKVKFPTKILVFHVPLSFNDRQLNFTLKITPNTKVSIIHLKNN